MKGERKDTAQQNVGTDGCLLSVLFVEYVHPRIRGTHSRRANRRDRSLLTDFRRRLRLKIRDKEAIVGAPPPSSPRSLTYQSYRSQARPVAESPPDTTKRRRLLFEPPPLYAYKPMQILPRHPIAPRHALQISPQCFQSTGRMTRTGRRDSGD